MWVGVRTEQWGDCAPWGAIQCLARPYGATDHVHARQPLFCSQPNNLSPNIATSLLLIRATVDTSIARYTRTISRCSTGRSVNNTPSSAYRISGEGNAIVLGGVAAAPAACLADLREYRALVCRTYSDLGLIVSGSPVRSDLERIRLDELVGIDPSRQCPAVFAAIITVGESVVGGRRSSASCAELEAVVSAVLEDVVTNSDIFYLV
jgi:hypothetical protein